MPLRWFAVLGGVLSLLVGAPATAQDSPIALWTPEQVASAIERQASRTSFAALEAFGRNAARGRAPDRLYRIEHVAWIMLNQSEFARFSQWNGLLKAEALKTDDQRFLTIARIDQLRSRYDQGDNSAGDAIAQIAGRETDWYAHIHAICAQAYVLVRQGKPAAALRLLSEADTTRASPEASAARAGVWEIEGLALMDLQDLNGSALAFGRSQIEFGRADYPRPDFDGVYDMASLAVRIGREDLAQTLSAKHHFLATRSDLSNLHIWDKNLCAMVAEGGGSAQGVLTCLDGLGPKLGAARFLATTILPARAIAYARLGRLKQASDDLKAMKDLEAAKVFEAAAFERLPQVEAEVLHARHKDAAAYEALRAYAAAHEVRQAQRFSAGIGQLTGEMAKQLNARRLQLATSQRNLVLKQDVIKDQRLLGLAGAGMGIAALALLLWQWKVAIQLKGARRTADAANLAKSEFLANMSHEIRTPLNGVVAIADMLVKADLGPKEREMAELIRSSGDTLQSLLSDILDLARIESGRINLDAAPFHAGDMVRNVAALSRLRCDEKGIGLELEIAPELEGVVIGDVLRVRQVLTNFLSNAVKFTDSGRIRLEAHRTPEGMARFRVTDSGVGFDIADKRRILARFQQADSSITRRFGGSGLGLAICCELAELMGGLIDCDSVAGEGSSFWMEAPLYAAEEQSSDPKGAAQCETTAPDRLRVLLADDHPTNRKVVELMLGGDIADLCSTEDGQAALAAFQAQAFDLVLMDMQMPVMDGLTAVREIRRWEADNGAGRTPIIMLTANALPEHVAAAQRAGADRHLAKPFTAPALFELIEEILAPPADPRSELAA